MASDFFERQDVARRNTAWLVVLFVAAVLAMIASIDVLLAGTMGYLSRDPRTGAIDWALALDPDLLLVATVGTIIVVGGGSLFKIAQLRGGGHVVAEMLGGRLITSDTATPSQQQLLNVVEEMAIASGAPAPPVYLMEHEDAINAFAAGFTPSDAVIAVTRGTVDRLTRDELQGVVAHEFSHILNGDMRLNIRLIGLLNGILIIGMIGYFVLRSAAFSGYGYRRRRSREGNPLPLLALGAGLMAVGFLGTFFGNLIKAAVSRQREFLADASAVQFTRQPAGIAGALKKIGGAVNGSTITNPNAPEASHLFFGRATVGLNALFSTHPPLAERIRRLDPAWDGTFVEAGTPPPRGVARAAVGMAGLAPAAAAAPTAANLVAQVGRPSEAHLTYASRFVHGLPAAIGQAARDPYGARALVYALLLDRRPETRRRQLARLAAAADQGVYDLTAKLAPSVDGLERRTRLPVVEVALPALRGLTPSHYERFKHNVTTLVEADDTIDLFEWSLQRILLHDLEVQHGGRRPAGVRYRSLPRLLPHCEVLLSLLAYAGHDDLPTAQEAFVQGARTLQAKQLRLLDPGSASLDALGRALDVLEEATPPVKRQVLDAAAACIGADRRVTEAEAEVLRAVSVSLGCPMPPLLQP